MTYFDLYNQAVRAQQKADNMYFSEEVAEARDAAKMELIQGYWEAVTAAAEKAYSGAELLARLLAHTEPMADFNAQNLRVGIPEDPPLLEREGAFNVAYILDTLREDLEELSTRVDRPELIEEARRAVVSPDQWPGTLALASAYAEALQ